MAEYKAQTIKKVLEENQRMEERKKEEFFHKKALAEERKRELDIEAEYERQRKIRYEREKEEQRQQVIELTSIRFQSLKRSKRTWSPGFRREWMDTLRRWLKVTRRL